MSKAIFSPLDWSLACMLIATFFSEGPLRDSDQVRLARILADQLKSLIQSGGRSSPICLTAIGVSDYLGGKYQQSISSFKRAQKEREKWPKETREFHRLDDARDLYFMTMAYAKLAQGASNRKHYETEARKCYDRAEEIYQGRKKTSPYIEYEDILIAVRNKAEGVLGGLKE